ncbi:MAG: glycosyltransferase family 2 protein [Elusimicrobiaceae bacterium]|nr:glycosyltransferase family 2 protein [Elusimicrobiaceae bacterium]
MTKIWLSICIPTCNRAEWLHRTLQSIVQEDCFILSEDIEIIISDNASSDNTQKIVEKFIIKYGSKIKYYKQSQFVCAMENFYKVCTLAQGKFIKLNNDTAHFRPGQLANLLDYIKQHDKDKSLLFFYNRCNTTPYDYCHNINEFVQKVSFYSTWSVAFGIWKTDSMYLSHFLTYKESQIAQTKILLDLLSHVHRPMLIINQPLYDISTPTKKGGYNIAEVFGYNYLNILKEFLNNGLLSSSIYNYEKKRLLLDHINPFYFDINNLWNFHRTGYFKWLWKDYKYCPYFYLDYLSMLYKRMKKIFKFKNNPTKIELL